jgi:hypothetical protein
MAILDEGLWSGDNVEVDDGLNVYVAVKLNVGVKVDVEVDVKASSSECRSSSIDTS